MKLIKNTIFFGILIFGLITNLSVLFDIQYLYLRAIFSFVFLTTIPGLLILLILRVRNIGIWEYLVYTVGLSISFIMFAGLVVNWILPWLNITDKPLSLFPLLISFNVSLSVFGLVAYKRNNKISLKLKFPKLNWLNKIFFITPVTFPILSVLGAINLNNHGSNYLIIIMLGGIASYVLLVVFFRKRLNKKIYPWVILMTSVSLILMGSLRGLYISHTDAAQEYALFRLTLSNNFWNYWLVKDSYNGMLSITILPVVYASFLKCNTFLISKLIFPILFSFLPVSIYILLRKFFNSTVSFFGVLFYIFQPAFTAWTLISPRQEIALLYFGLMLLVLFSEKISINIKKVLFIIFGFSMIVSHYSTSYIAIVLFALFYITYFCYRKLTMKKLLQNKLLAIQRYHFHLTGGLILLLITFLFVWYFKLTTTGQGLSVVANKSFTNLNKIFSENMYSAGSSPLEYLHVFGTGNNSKVNSSADLIDFNQEIIKKNKHNPSTKEELDKYPLSIETTSQLPLKSGYLFDLSEQAKRLLIIIGVLLIVVGLIFYGVFNKKVSKPFLIMSLVFMSSFILLVLLPSASIYYNPHRIYQQVLILLAVFSIYGCSMLFKFNRFMGYFLFSLFLVLYFVLFTHAEYYFVGGREVQLRFANIGKDYDLHYVSSNEIYSTNWLFAHKEVNTPIVTDQFANYKMYQAENFNFNSAIKMDVLPAAISPEDYVFSSRSNTLQKITFKYYGRGLLIYNFPTLYLNDNKNKIYNNGGSEIFK